MWESQRRMADLLRDAEMDVIGLLESDTQVRRTLPFALTSPALDHGQPRSDAVHRAHARLLHGHRSLSSIPSVRAAVSPADLAQTPGAQRTFTHVVAMC